MKFSLIACLMLCFSSVFAQLSVRNNAFVYVNDQVLYVEDDVNLEESTTKLYLRNESQLIQGAGTTGNSGIGELSVYQNGTVNQWAYNYWCSPVGGILTDNFINNDFRINQLDDPLLSTMNPIDSNNSIFTASYNGTASPLIISDRWLWTYVSSSAYADWIYAGDAGDIDPGLGFTMKGSGTASTGNTTYDFRGKPNNGTMANPVAAGDFTLVGNPYPSAMDSAAFIHDTQNQAAITGTLFYWEQDASTPQTQSHVLQDYVGGYSEFTINSSGVIISNTPAVFYTYDEQDNVYSLPPGPPATGTKTAQRYIPIGQGFMVEGSVGTSGVVRAKNEHRAYVKEGAQSYFFRNGDATNTDTDGIQFQENGLPIVPEDYKRFRVNVDFTVGQSQYTRQLLLNFHDTATAGFDYGLELSRSDNHPSDTYFTLNDKAYSAQAYPFEEVLAIPLVVDIEQQQPLRFRIFDIQNFDDSQGIYIHDIENELYVNLREQDYELNIEPGSYTNRFEIVFTPGEALSIDDFEVSKLTIRQNNDLHQLAVLNPNGLDIKSIEVFDVAGKRMLNNQYDSVSNRYELSTVDLSDGVYIVNVTSNTNTVKSEKVIVKN
ncbi:T9SS type A sorting domain-containing protein [Winogradskyella sp.]|uniref:T9SS type A sorting domain-containing protein n=1 Tax=Winogradskyella sp. TaxID=1883156 RepID=UPI001B0B9B12|nr:T9SS type A sorting domain-containing protein [Winogradskyella sp.]MBO6880795.1 T9SS type A sorting domain-containing protein [Winogradskyella sp.]